MRILKAFTIILFLTIVNFANAQQILPFHLTEYNNILLKSVVNNKDSLYLMYQIAMQDAAISPQRTRSAENVNFNSLNTVRIGTSEFKDILFSDNELAGYYADGKIGNGLFKEKHLK